MHEQHPHEHDDHEHGAGHACEVGCHHEDAINIIDVGPECDHRGDCGHVHFEDAHEHIDKPCDHHNCSHMPHQTAEKEVDRPERHIHHAGCGHVHHEAVSPYIDKPIAKTEMIAPAIRRETIEMQSPRIKPDQLEPTTNVKEVPHDIKVDHEKQPEAIKHVEPLSSDDTERVIPLADIIDEAETETETETERPAIKAESVSSPPPAEKNVAGLEVPPTRAVQLIVQPIPAETTTTIVETPVVTGETSFDEVDEVIEPSVIIAPAPETRTHEETVVAEGEAEPLSSKIAQAAEPIETTVYFNEYPPVVQEAIETAEQPAVLEQALTTVIKELQSFDPDIEPSMLHAIEQIMTSYQTILSPADTLRLKECIERIVGPVHDGRETLFEKTAAGLFTENHSVVDPDSGTIYDKIIGSLALLKAGLKQPNRNSA